MRNVDANIDLARRSYVVRCLLLVACLILLTGRAANAQLGVDIIHAFPIPGAVGAKGSLIQASDGNFYGVTEHGGRNNCGTIFRMTPSGSVMVLHNFECPAVRNYPILALVQASDGFLYGTSQAEDDAFFAFRMTLDGMFEVIHTFNNEVPTTPLVEGTDGNLYGAVFGRIFRMTPSGNVVTVHDIRSAEVRVLTSGPDGTLYAAMIERQDLPPSCTATIFALSQTGAFTSLYTVTDVLHPYPFDPCLQMFATGFNVAALVPSDGALYGVDTQGHGRGVVFKLGPNGLTELPVFAGTPETVGAEPIGLTLGADGNFYGLTTKLGSFGHGTVFRMTPDGVATPIHAFNKATDGGRPAGSLLRTADGSFVGLTEESNDEPGPVTAKAFSISTSGEFSVLHPFADTNGAAPNYLTQGADGNFYGTTAEGGAYNFGVLFRLGSNGTTDVLHDFPFQDRIDFFPSLPAGIDKAPKLMQAADGNFYGTTFGSGPNHGGLFFRATPSGEYVDLVNFNGFKGAQPLAPPIQASDGALYGTTPFLGVFVGDSGGSVYRLIRGAADLTTVHAFDSSSEGGAISAAVIEAADGALYGTAGKGGDADLGTVFRMSIDGSSVTALHSFGGADGSGPVAPLIQASDGNFYGTTFSGGPADLGTVFRVTPSGSFNLLHTFNGVDGANPTAALIQASDGNLYGVTQGGGTHGRGAVFRLTLTGTFRLMHSFDGSDGERPSRRLIQGSDGFLYGTAERGGPSGGGVVFRLVDVSCEDTLSLSYSDSTLNIGFHIRSAVPTNWGTWLVTPRFIRPLWLVPIPAVSPAVSFNVPIPQFPHLGFVGVLTIMGNSDVQSVCGDWKIVNTSTP